MIASSSCEKIVYFGYAFLNSKGRCEAYVPYRSNAVVDDQDFITYCMNNYSVKEDLRGREVCLVVIKNIPKIGDRVDSGKYLCEFGIAFSEIDDLKPIGKFGLDRFYNLKGTCRLESLSIYEKSFTPSELIKHARKTYLKYLETNPEGPVRRSPEERKRLGLDIHLDAILGRTPKKAAFIATKHINVCSALISVVAAAIVSILILYLFFPTQNL